ncbi:MAG: hypothetical protein VX610_10780 [SAR324 cluster bacterium]|nr:hypothetical protein [SAR324 cluster bacterium]
MTTRIHLVSAISLALLLPGWAWGLEAFTRPQGQPAHLEMGNFQIYPIHRFGNALYLKQALLKRFPERSVRAALNIRDDRGVLALVEEQDGSRKLELIRTADDQEGRLRRGRGEFYEFADYKAGIQQVFRIRTDHIELLSPGIRTASGLTLNDKHAVFYHISESQEVEVDGQTKRRYTFRLHLVKRNAPGKVLLRKLRIEDTSARLRLGWRGPTILTATLSNGGIQEIDLRDHAPALF